MREPGAALPDALVAGLAPVGLADARGIALPFQGRPVLVIVGMHRSGAAVLAKLLQLLGVDMADAIGTDAILGNGMPSWERAEIAAFNDRLLAMIGRPLAGAVHALPFPPGWWADPPVLALKREVQAWLRRTLDGQYGLWGFKDLRISRLLPFWQQVFDEMGLQPVWLWTVRDPAETGASAVASRLVANAEIAEAMWFIYNAEIHKFIGDDALAVVDFADWSAEPARIVDRLLARLPLTWRGSQGELLECVRACTGAGPRRSAPPPIRSPLVQAFYEAIRDPDRSETSLRHRGSVTQAVDILRTLVAPYAALVGAGGPALDPPGVAPKQATAPTDDSALQAALARAEEAEAALRETEEVLTREIEARVAENSWLQQRSAEHKLALAAGDEGGQATLAAAQAEAARLRKDLDASRAELKAQHTRIEEVVAAAERQRKATKGELEEARRELALQRTASEKYLSRIYELKATRRDAGDAAVGPAG